MRIAQIGHQVQHLGLHGYVQGAHGLVRHDQLGPGDQRAGNRNTLALPAREFVRVFVQRVGAQPDGGQRFGGAVALLAAAGAFQRGGGLGHGAPHRAARVQRTVGVLKHHLKIAPRGAQVGGAQGIQVAPFEQHLPAVGPLQRHGQARQRALARSRFAHDAHAAPRRHLQRHALERLHHAGRAQHRFARQRVRPRDIANIKQKRALALAGHALAAPVCIACGLPASTTSARLQRKLCAGDSRTSGGGCCAQPPAVKAQRPANGQPSGI